LSKRGRESGKWREKERDRDLVGISSPWVGLKREISSYIHVVVRVHVRVHMCACVGACCAHACKSEKERKRERERQRERESLCACVCTCMCCVRLCVYNCVCACVYAYMCVCTRVHVVPARMHTGVCARTRASVCAQYPKTPAISPAIICRCIATYCGHPPPHTLESHTSVQLSVSARHSRRQLEINNSMRAATF